MEPVRMIRGRTAVLPRRDIDTDQIIPARHLKVATKHGLGRWLFGDWRYDAEGRPRPDFALHAPEAQGAEVLVAGDNFGCGSSREHAPWALLDHGFRAVVSTSFADIFRNNSLKNGLVPVVVDEALHQRLLAAPGATVTIDVAAQTIALEDGAGVRFPLDPFARYCLLNGLDELQYLLDAETDIAAYEQRAR